MLGHLVSRAINGVLTPTLTLQLSHCNELANGEDDVLSIGHPDLSIVSLPWNFLSGVGIYYVGPVGPVGQ